MRGILINLYYDFLALYEYEYSNMQSSHLLEEIAIELVVRSRRRHSRWWSDCCTLCRWDLLRPAFASTRGLDARASRTIACGWFERLRTGSWRRHAEEQPALLKRTMQIHIKYAIRWREKLKINYPASKVQNVSKAYIHKILQDKASCSRSVRNAFVRHEAPRD